MPNRNDRRGNNTSPYDEMSDEMLRDILRADAEKPEGDEADVEQLLCVMEVLAKRRQENETVDSKTAFTAFKKYYLSEEIPAPALKKLPAGKNSRWKRGLTAAAAVLAILIGGTATAGALGVDVIQYVAKWTEDAFYFAPVLQSGQWNDPHDPTSGAWADLRELLAANGITAELVPTWVPEGYEFLEVKDLTTGDSREFISTYSRGEETLSVYVGEYLSEAPLQIQQSTGTAEIYRSGSVDYYIIFNLERISIAWINEGYECCISGPLTVPEAKMMIDSIPKG